MRTPSLARHVALSLTAGAVIFPVLMATVETRSQGRTPIPQEFGAPGGPIFDCAGMADSIARLRSGLPVQDEWIRRTEAQLREAERGNLESQAARNAAFQSALEELATKQIEQAVTLRRQVEAMRSAGLGLTARREALERIAQMKQAAERLDQLGKLRKAGAAGFDFGTALRENVASLRHLATFLDESGLADELATTVATYAVPGVGVLVVESFKVLRDLGFAQWQVNMTADEMDAARRNLAAMRDARDDVRTRIYEYEIEMVRGCPQTKASESPQQTQPSSGAGTPSSSPPAPPAATPPQQKSGSNDLLFYGGLAAVVGGAYAYSEYKKLGGEQCTPPPNNVNACFQNASSSTCQQWLAERRAYCSCLGLTSNAGNCQ